MTSIGPPHLGQSQRGSDSWAEVSGSICDGTVPSAAKLFLLAQPVFFASLVVASFWHMLPPLVIVAFRKPESLDVRSLGWSEMKQGLVFGVLFAVALIYS